ncbi:hypothetical protein [Paraburkholderia fungorum]|uniref:hypothetical protein n=1 Tax=Paraburkholderia fungorum TaxID=134537 RepID=UPI002092E53D|nr:hypothetical protein [Paraburkholderia fungorum]USU18831.1 hypothetical protein NFE55_32260 [Paraburkholderia fungorum]USU29173.1 hypothetical protein NFS19_29310 [Paraburkholderia fungorum]
MTGNEFWRKLALTHLEKRLTDLLKSVWTGAATDIEVAAGDLQISDASFMRSRRAMDCVARAQLLLESIGAAGATETRAMVRGDGHY